jgi:F-type H+-transporting ATPase subunit b
MLTRREGGVLIDWFTVGAQVVNVVVLAVVLKVVLFDKVVAAMQRREEAITTRIRDAEARERGAADAEEAFLARSRQLEQERQGRLLEAQDDADRRRSDLLAEARTHVAELRAGWEAGLRRERTTLLSEVRRRTGEQACAVARQALVDLADGDLEAQVVRTALRRIEQSPGPLQTLSRGPNRDQAATVSITTSFILPDDLAEQLTTTVAARLGVDVADVRLDRDAGLVCGLAIHACGWSVSWSIDSYLEAVVEDVDALLPQDGA